MISSESCLIVEERKLFCEWVDYIKWTQETLRIVVEPRQQGVSVTLLKSRGGARGSIVVEWKG